MLSLFHNDLEISKDTILKYALGQNNVEKLSKIDHQIIAMFDISGFNSPLGKSIIIHEQLGVVSDLRTTRQLVNEFYKTIGVGFAMSKITSAFFQLSHHMPLVHAYVSYMPMTGASRRNTDWIALHLIERYFQKDKFAHFITHQGMKLKLHFPHGDLENRIHDVCLLSEKSVAILRTIVKVGLADLKSPPVTGVVERFKKCNCPLHQKMLANMFDINHTLKILINFVLSHLGIEDSNPSELIKFYQQNLSRVRKLY